MSTSGDDTQAKVTLKTSDFAVEDSSDFDDPDTKTATIHTIPSESTVILRMLVSETTESSSVASISYRIQGQDNVVTSINRGFGGNNAPGTCQTGGGFGSVLFGAPAGNTFGAPAAAASPFGLLLLSDHMHRLSLRPLEPIP